MKKQTSCPFLFCLSWATVAIKGRSFLPTSYTSSRFFRNVSAQIILFGPRNIERIRNITDITWGHALGSSNCSQDDAFLTRKGRKLGRKPVAAATSFSITPSFNCPNFPSFRKNDELTCWQPIRTSCSTVSPFWAPFTRHFSNLFVCFTRWNFRQTKAALGPLRPTPQPAHPNPSPILNTFRIIPNGSTGQLISSTLTPKHSTRCTFVLKLKWTHVPPYSF